MKQNRIAVTTMQPAKATQTELQLNQLVQQGTDYLRRAAVERARQQAFNKACLFLWVLPLLSAGLFASDVDLQLRGLIAIIGGAIAIPFMTYLAVLVDISGKTKPGRQQALAIYDQQLGLKDDLQIADEFRLKPSPTEFEQAALASFKPALAKALQHTLSTSIKSPIVLSTRQWIQCALAVVVLLAILTIVYLKQHIGASSDGSEQAQQSSLAYPDKVQEPARGTMPDGTQLATMQQANISQRSSLEQHESRQQTILTNNIAEQSHRTNTAPDSIMSLSSGSTAHEGTQNNNEGSSQSRQATPLPALNENAPNGAIQAGEQADSSQTGDLLTSKQADDSSKERKASSSDNRASQQAEQQKSAELAPSSPAAAQQAQRSQKKSSESGNKKGQQQSSGSQQNSNSQNSNTQGDDAQKKSRGINQLMLSIPMEDQFIGTPGPGLEKSTTEKMPSQEKPFDASDSASRGQGTYASTFRQKLITQAWQKQLMNEFFKQQHQTSQQNESGHDN